MAESDLWRFLCRAFDVRMLHIAPVSGIACKPFLREHATLDDILNQHRDHAIVFFDERAEILLTDFDHPETALYVFGKANYSPLLSHARDDDHAVRIETVDHRGLLWSHQAAAIALHDRRRQWP